MNTVKDDGGPAFPTKINSAIDETGGLTLRDYFAGQAITAMAAELYQQGRDKRMIYENAFTSIADGAYEMADAMIAARSK